MHTNYEIKKASDLINYLINFEKREFAYDFDYQLQTNHGFVYNLKDGKVIFLPNNFQGDGLIFDSQNCFKATLDSEYFPIENPNKTIFDYERERIFQIHKQIAFYKDHLNTVLKFDFKNIDRDVGHAYLKKIVGRTIKRLTTPADLVGLIAIFGEIIKKEKNGKWFLLKRYGKYNPIFEPDIVLSDNRVITISELILSNIKWKTTNLDTIFNDKVPWGYGTTMTYDRFSKRGNCFILE